MPLYHYQLSGSLKLDSSPLNPTSNTFQGWTMSTDNVRSDWTDKGAFSAFCQESKWGSDNGYNHWVQWTNGTSIVVSKYSLIPTYNSGTYGSTAWQLQGSDDGSNWTTIHTKATSDTYTADSLIDTGNTTPYLYHRILVTSVKTHAYLQRVRCYSGALLYISSGIDQMGYPIVYDSASQADCNLFVFPSDYIWGYRGGKLLPNNTITATGNVTADTDGYFTFGSNNYFTFDSFVLTGSSPRTFVLNAVLSASNIQLIDGGDTSGGKMFGIGWGRNTNKLFYHCWSADNASWLDLAAGQYMLAIVYTGSALLAYKDGALLGSATLSLNTGQKYNYRIGCYICDDWRCSGTWKSRFCAVYDRALSATQISTIKV